MTTMSQKHTSNGLRSTAFSGDIRHIVNMIAHCDEQVEETAQICEYRIAALRSQNRTHSALPPACISICIVPLRLKTLRLRIINVRK